MTVLSQSYLACLLLPAILLADASKEPKSATESKSQDDVAAVQPRQAKKDEVKKSEARPELPEKVVREADVSTILEEELREFEANPEGVKRVIRAALSLTRLNLTYLYASHDVCAGGMDCSGAIYRVLMDEKVSGVPRQSDEMCSWTEEKGTFHRTEKVAKLDEPAFEPLKPGDLLFWSRKGGAEKGRKLPVTHVMLFLGHRVRDGKPVIYGSSDGRSYEGQRRCGVSVFDFTLPKFDDPKVEFYGFGAVPGLVKEEVRQAVRAPVEKGMP